MTTKDAAKDRWRFHAGCLRHRLRATGDLVATIPRREAMQDARC